MSSSVLPAQWQFRLKYCSTNMLLGLKDDGNRWQPFTDDHRSGRKQLAKDVVLRGKYHTNSHSLFGWGGKPDMRSFESQFCLHSIALVVLPSSKWLLQHYQTRNGSPATGSSLCAIGMRSTHCVLHILEDDAPSIAMPFLGKGQILPSRIFHWIFVPSNLCCLRSLWCRECADQSVWTSELNTSAWNSALVTVTCKRNDYSVCLSVGESHFVAGCHLQ